MSAKRENEGRSTGSEPPNPGRSGLSRPGPAAVERAAYTYPWSLGIFRDCLRVGYLCRVAELGREIATSLRDLAVALEIQEGTDGEEAARTLGASEVPRLDFADDSFDAAVATFEPYRRRGVTG